MIQISGWYRAAILFLSLLVFPALLVAQAPRLRGQVTDPAGLPVAGITVSLHRVSEGGGAEVGRALSDAEGRFEIELDPDLADGIYFAATRFDGTLYMGEPFRTVAEAPSDYRVVIGSGGVAGGPAVQAGEQPTEPQGLGVVLIFVALGVAAVGIPLWRSRRGPHAVRGVLVELAELDEHFAAQPGTTRTMSEPEYRAAREELRARLKLLAGAQADAADND